MSTRKELTLEGAAEMTTTVDGLFKVDGAKCVKCGLCVQDCAFGALRMDDSRTAPFYAVLFGKEAVRYARGVRRDAYARTIYWEKP